MTRTHATRCTVTAPAAFHLGARARASALATMLVASLPGMVAAQQHVLTTNFKYETYVQQGAAWTGLAVGPNNSNVDVVWVGAYASGTPLNWTGGDIWELNPSTSTYLPPPHTGNPWNSNGPASLAYDPNGFLWVASYTNNRLYKVGVFNSFNIATQISLAGMASAGPTGGLAFDEADLWVATRSSTTIHRVSTTGPNVTVLQSIDMGYEPAGMEYAHGYLFVADPAAQSKINAYELSALLALGAGVVPTPFRSFAFPPAAGAGFGGDIGIDATTGLAYYGRSGANLHRMRLFDRLESFCFGDGVGAAWPYADGTVSNCPCSNNGAPGHGCANSVYPAGGLLSVSGTPSVSNDTLVLSASSLSGNVALFFQGTDFQDVPFDDGKICVAGSLVRVGQKQVAGGACTNPSGVSPALSVFGSVPAAGATRYYQAVYRNAQPFCLPATSNRTNGVIVPWLP